MLPKDEIHLKTLTGKQLPSELIKKSFVRKSSFSTVYSSEDSSKSHCDKEDIKYLSSSQIKPYTIPTCYKIDKTYLTKDSFYIATSHQIQRIEYILNPDSKSLIQTNITAFNLSSDTFPNNAIQKFIFSNNKVYVLFSKKNYLICWDAKKAYLCYYDKSAYINDMEIDTNGNLFGSYRNSIFELSFGKDNLRLFKSSNEENTEKYKNEFFMKNGSVKKAKKVSFKNHIYLLNENFNVKKFVVGKSFYCALLGFVNDSDQEMGGAKMKSEKKTSDPDVFILNWKKKSQKSAFVKNFDKNEVLTFDMSETNQILAIAKKDLTIELYKLNITSKNKIGGKLKPAIPLRNLSVKTEIDSKYHDLVDKFYISHNDQIGLLYLDKMFVSNDQLISTTNGGIWCYNFFNETIEDTKHDLSLTNNNELIHVYKYDHRKNPKTKTNRVGSERKLSGFCQSSIPKKKTKFSEMDKESRSNTLDSKDITIEINEMSQSRLKDNENKDNNESLISENPIEIDPYMNLIVFTKSDQVIIANKRNHNCVMITKVYENRINLPWIRSVSLSINSQYLAASDSEGSVTIFDYITRKEILKLIGHHDQSIYCNRFSPNQNILATCSADSIIKLYDVDKRKLKLRFRNAKPGQQITSLSYSPDGRSMIFGSFDGTVSFWNLILNRRFWIMKLFDMPVYCVNYAPNGKKVAVASNDGTIKIIDIISRKVLIHFDKAHTQILDNREHIGIEKFVNSVKFSYSGKQLASGSSDYTMKLFDLEKKSELKHFREFKNWVRSVDFSPDDSMLVGCDYAGNVLIYSTTGNYNSQFRITGVDRSWLMDVAFNRFGDEVIIGTQSGKLIIYALNSIRSVCDMDKLMLKHEKKKIEYIDEKTQMLKPDKNSAYKNHGRLNQVFYGTTFWNQTSIIAYNSKTIRFQSRIDKDGCSNIDLDNSVIIEFIPNKPDIEYPEKGIFSFVVGTTTGDVKLIGIHSPNKNFGTQGLNTFEITGLKKVCSGEITSMILTYYGMSSSLDTIYNQIVGGLTGEVFHLQIISLPPSLDRTQPVFEFDNISIKKLHQFSFTHKGKVNTIESSYDKGKFIFTGGDDGCLAIFRTVQQEVFQKLQLFQSPIYCIKKNCNFNFLGVAGYGQVKLVKNDRGKFINLMCIDNALDGAIRCIYFNAFENIDFEFNVKNKNIQDSFMVCGGDEGCAKVWLIKKSNDEFIDHSDEISKYDNYEFECIGSQFGNVNFGKKIVSMDLQLEAFVPYKTQIVVGTEDGRIFGARIENDKRE